jgi:hypothetical protein
MQAKSRPVAVPRPRDPIMAVVPQIRVFSVAATVPLGSWLCPAKRLHRSDLLHLFSTCSRHLFRAYNDMATAVYGGAVLFASVTFLRSSGAGSVTGQSPLPENAVGDRPI